MTTLTRAIVALLLLAGVASAQTPTPGGAGCVVYGSGSGFVVQCADGRGWAVQ